VKQLRELTAREMYIVRAALDTFSDLVEDSSIPVAGIGEMAGDVDAAEIVRVMGAFPEAPAEAITDSPRKTPGRTPSA
jgi:hypothetical protein